MRKKRCNRGPSRNSLDELFRGKEYEQFMQGVSMKKKLALYKEFGENLEIKSYLRGNGDAGTRLLLKLRSGTNGLMEELGRHRDKENDRVVRYVAVSVRV